MDESTFDRIARRLVANLSRRRAIGALAGVAGVAGARAGAQGPLPVGQDSLRQAVRAWNLLPGHDLQFVRQMPLFQDGQGTDLLRGELSRRMHAMRRGH